MQASPIAANEDRRFMALALALGGRGLGLTWPNPAVGAVVVQHRDGTPILVGRGWTQPGGRPHAETEALARAGRAARGATLYVTLEPCSHHGQTPPCVDAIVGAGVARVVSALEDANPGVAGKGHARLRREGLKVEVGVGADEAARAHAGHFRRMRDGRPHVLLKLALSADDKIAPAGRSRVTITGQAAHERVHAMRAKQDAVLIGIGTALADDPLLTCRLPGMHSPIRIVLDTHLKLPLESKLVRSAREIPVWVMTGRDAREQSEQALRASGVEVIRSPASGGRLDIGAALTLLARRGLTRVMVEGGAKVAAAFVAADCVDEAALFRSAKVIGAGAVDALEGMPLSALTQSRRLTPCGHDMVGEDSVVLFERTGLFERAR